MKNLLKNQTINNFCIKILNISIFNRTLRRKLRKNLKWIVIYDFIEKLSKEYPDYYQFAMFKPWGDFFITASLLNSFKKLNNNAKILCLCLNDSQKNILSTFNCIDKIIKIPENIYYKLFDTRDVDCYHQVLTKGKLYRLSHWNFDVAPQNKSENLLELYAKMLNLNYPTALFVSESDNKKYQNYSNTVLICPKSTSISDKDFDISFWINLANKISDFGYKVVFNSKEKIFENYETIFLPMIEQIKMAQCCKAVISVRSGFSDIMALYKIKNHIVLYPQNLYFKTITAELHEKEFNRCFYIDKDKTFSQNVFRISTLDMYQNNTAKEIVFTNNQLTISEINEFIKNKLNF